jgi:hypothetical protein
MIELDAGLDSKSHRGPPNQSIVVHAEIDRKYRGGQCPSLTADHPILTAFFEIGVGKQEPQPVLAKASVHRVILNERFPGPDERKLFGSNEVENLSVRRPIRTEHKWPIRTEHKYRALSGPTNRNRKLSLQNEIACCNGRSREELPARRT